MEGNSMNVKQREAMSDPEVRRVFEEELLFGEATDTAAALLESLGKTQRELARRLGVSEGRISQILSGAENLTLRTLAAVGWALGVRFQLDSVPMADRQGTPAQDDPPVPAWLGLLRPRSALVFRDVSRPETKKPAPALVRRPQVRRQKEIVAA